MDSDEKQRQVAQEQEDEIELQKSDLKMEDFQKR